MYRAVDIKWDTDGDEELLATLPKEMDIPNGVDDSDYISDWISDETGFCHHGFRLVDQDGNDIHELG